MQLVFSAVQELPFKRHDKSPSSFNRINYIELLEYRYTKKYDTVLNAHLQATTFTETSISLNDLNDLMKTLQIFCWMQLQKTFKNVNLWQLFKMKINCSCREGIR